MRILSNMRKIFCWSAHTSSVSFFWPQWPLHIALILLGAVASVKFLAIENMPPHFFGSCLLWRNGWMDQDTTWYGGTPRLR